MIQPRGTLSTRRMSAYSVVLAATALTTLVTATVAAALAVFAGQALPLAVRHNLSAASGTALAISGPVTNGQLAATEGTLRAHARRSLHGVPFGFWSGTWSDTLNLVPGALPARPASTGGSNTPLLVAASLDGAASHAVLVSGHWPGAPGAGKSPANMIPAALPQSAAALLHVSPGDVLTLRDGISNATARFRITGLFAQRKLTGAAASYWSLDTIGSGGLSSQSGFTTYGPLLVSPGVFARGQLTADTGVWLAQPDMTRFTDTDLSTISGDVSAFKQSLQYSGTLSGLELTTTLPSVLSATASNLSVARSLLEIVALQLLVLAAAALMAAARLLVTQREGETALLIARGANRWQLMRLTAAEVIPLCGLTAVIGGLAGIRLSSLLATAGPLAGADIHIPGPALLTGGAGSGAAGTWLDAAAATVIVALIAVAAMLGPVLGSGPAMTEARVRRGRQAIIANATRAGADVALVALAVLAGWQLRRYSAASTGPNTLIDPVLALAPALALAGGTVITLRLLPIVARAGNRLAGRGRRLTAALAGWQVSRQPLRQGGAALLLVMAVATGSLALAQHASWIRSASDQGSFAAGADVRIDTPSAVTPDQAGAIAGTAGVQHDMAAYLGQNATDSTALGSVLGIDTARAGDIVRIRPDQTGIPESRLFGLITPKSPPGTEIPVRHGMITFTASLSQSSGQNSGQDGGHDKGAGVAGIEPVSVTVTVTDGTGDTYQLNAGTLPADGQNHTLTASLGGDKAPFPFRLLQVQLSYQMPFAENTSLRFTETGLPLAGWQAGATSPEMTSLQQQGGTYGPTALPSDGRWQASGHTAAFGFRPGYGRQTNDTPGRPVVSRTPVDAQLTLNAPGGDSAQPLSAIATSAFADANNVGPGSVVPVSLGGVQIPLSIVAVVRTFPTITAADGGAVIADLPGIQQRLLTHGAEPVNVTEWWLASGDHAVPAGLARALPPGSAVTGAAETTAALTGDPLSAAPQQALLALAIAAALLAITGFWVSIASNLRQRRAETALLAALGVSQRSAAVQLCLEKLLLSVPSALLGLVLGTVVARLLVPAVTLNSAAGQPVPPPLILYDLPQTLPLAVAVAIIPALAAALIMIRRPDPAAELRAAEAA